ncbi:hypothetical protein ACIA8C_09865 [Nocardia sp. NPDC051321]|uniref:hypothetical protein n=1 Tax=Nocardia sp. NPDC051321 TaxID=3364323 RepID=UPI00378DF618
MIDTAATIGCPPDGPVSYGFGYPVVISALLPSQDRLLAAISGQLNDAAALSRLARELGDLHASLIPYTVDPDFREGFDPYMVYVEIAECETAINSWAALHLPRNPIARRHTQSLGELVSQIARIYAQACWTMRHTDDKQTEHEAWFHVAEVIDGYAELVDQVVGGRVQLPLGWRGLYGAAPRAAA